MAATSYKKAKTAKKGVVSKLQASLGLTFTQGEWPIYFILTLVLLLAFGLMALFSASHVSAYLESGNSYKEVYDQARFLGVGLVAMVLISLVDYHVWRRFILAGYLISFALLGFVLVCCDKLNDAKRWIYWESIKGIPAIQVSEIVKFVIILVTAQILCHFYQTKKNGFVGIVVPFLLALPLMVLIFVQPHLSCVIIIFSVIVVMVLMSGVGIWYVVGAIILSPPLAWGAYQIILRAVDVAKINYVAERLAGWTFDVTQMDWQTKQSIYAIGSGGLTGLGLGNGVQKQMWLPEATNDFIFSVICEELGFFGAMVVIVLFIVFVAQGFVIALEAADLFGSLVAIGITAQIGVQFAFNIGVVTSLLPNTGISLPFFSSGGTSLMMLLAQMGVMISIARLGKAEKLKQQEDTMRARVAAEQMKKNQENHRQTKSSENTMSKNRR